METCCWLAAGVLLCVRVLVWLVVAPRHKRYRGTPKVLWIGLLAIMAVTACGAAAPIGAALTGPCSPTNCEAGNAQLNIPYSYGLSTHCGVLEARFNGRFFYPDSLYESDIPASLMQPVDWGTMTLTSPKTATFEDLAGHSIRLLDSPPGVIGKAYPFSVHVLAGGNSLADEQFAGRVWHPQALLAGMTGPPYGNGHDASTIVAGTFTIMSNDDAVFVTAGAAKINFVRVAFVCD